MGASIEYIRVLNAPRHNSATIAASIQHTNRITDAYNQDRSQRLGERGSVVLYSSNSVATKTHSKSQTASHPLRYSNLQPKLAYNIRRHCKT